MPVEALRHRLGLPDRALAESLVDGDLIVERGRVAGKGSRTPDALRELIDKAFAPLGPFTAPEANDLAALGAGPKQLAAAVRNGLVVQVAPGVVLRAGAPERAAAALAALPQPFTLSAARQALGTTRRVAVPLLELLDRAGLTERHPDDRRSVTRRERFA
jgi:selenocysteine-specific elongation factor